MQTVTLLFSLFFAALAHGQNDLDTPAPVAPAAPVADSSLRPRLHNLSVEFSNMSLKTTPSVGASTESRSGRLSGSYGYEFGRFQPYVNFSSSLSASGDIETTTASFGLGVRGAFIENKPGNDLIPFVFFALSGVRGKSKNGTATVDTKGSASELGAGLDWYPFGELFAFRFTLTSMNMDIDADSGVTSLKTESSAGQFAVGYVLSF